MAESPMVMTIEDAARPKPVVMLRVGGQLFGLPVREVRDVLHLPDMTPIPLAPPLVAGLINLRGALVTVIDLRERFGIPSRPASLPGMLVVVEHRQERVALLVDTITGVESFAEADAEEVPATMDDAWRGAATELYPCGKELALILDVTRLLSLTENAQ